MVLLHELDIHYPPTKSLPIAIGPWVPCKLVQYPMKDQAGNVVAGEYRQPIFSALFTTAVVFMGKITTRTMWTTGQQNQSGAGREIHGLKLDIYSDEDILDWIEQGNVFIYINKDDEDAAPLTIEEYKQLNADSKKAIVAPTPQDSAPQQAGVSAG